jgi:hypothetical protein
MLFVGIQGLAQRLQYAPPVPVWPLGKSVSDKTDTHQPKELR